MLAGLYRLYAALLILLLLHFALFVVKRFNWLNWLRSKNLFKKQLKAVEDKQDIKPLRWGIAPVTLIAEDFATALRVLPKGHHSITSCVDPYRTLATSYADRHSVSNIYTNFEDLARCPFVGECMKHSHH